MDIQKAEINPIELYGHSFLRYEVFPHKDIVHGGEINKKIPQALKLMREARRPLVIVGGGIRVADQVEEARKFVHQLGFPVVTSWSGFGIIPHNHPFYAGPFGVYGHRAANFAVQNSDLLIVLGSRLDTRQTGGNRSVFAPDAKKIVVDVDSEELNKGRGMNIDLAVNADIRAFFKCWKEQCENELFDHNPDSKWIKTISGWKEHYLICDPEYYNQKSFVNPYIFMKVLSKLTPENAVVVTDCGGNLTWTMQGFEPKADQYVFSAMGNSPMGYSMAAAIGASIALGGKPVICIIGDGGMQVNIQELQTLVYYKLPVKIFLLNSNSYAIITNFQDEVFNGNYCGVTRETGYSCPDFLKVAQAYGIDGAEVRNHDGLESVIRMTLAKDGPFICDVKILENQRLIPKTQFGNPLHDMYPFLPRDEIASIMASSK